MATQNVPEGCARIYDRHGQVIETAPCADYYFTQEKLGGPYRYLGSDLEPATGDTATSCPSPADCAGAAGGPGHVAGPGDGADVTDPVRGDATGAPGAAGAVEDEAGMAEAAEGELIRCHRFLRTSGDDVLVTSRREGAPPSEIPTTSTRPARVVIGALGVGVAMLALVAIPWSAALAVFVAIAALFGLLLGFFDKPPVNYLLAGTVLVLLLGVLPVVLLWPR